MQVNKQHSKYQSLRIRISTTVEYHEGVEILSRRI
jgi:hypothetical protein